MRARGCAGLVVLLAGLLSACSITGPPPPDLWPRVGGHLDLDLQFNNRRGVGIDFDYRLEASN